MKFEVTKPKLKKLFHYLKEKKPNNEFEKARTNLSSDSLEKYVLMKLKEQDGK
jgi:hypothetical protein